MNQLKSQNLLGLPVLEGSRVQIRDYLLDRYRQGIKTQVLTINPEMMMAMRSDPSIRELLAQAEAVVADGVGIQFAARLMGYERIMRYPGVELALDLLKALPGSRVFLLGSRPGVAEAAAAQLEKLLPQANIVGSRDGYFQRVEDAAIAAKIAEAGTDILLVGMGSPRQEQFIASARLSCNARLMIGVGGSLEVYAGVKQRAPQWIRNSGMEWLHRISQDSGRLSRLGSLPRFVNLVMREYVGKLNDQV